MTNNMNGSTFFKDLSAGVVVFLVALPLCLGIALASNAPLISGLIAGIVGGLIVSWISGSHTSVSGPAAGLTAIVFAQIEKLGSYEAFLGAVILAGVLQLVMGWLRAGSLAAFFPSSVIKGLLAAIGIILILKQIPHLFGHDPDWMGDMSFMQPDGENTFSELLATRFDIHIGATFVGLFSLLLLIFWDKTPLKRIPVPAPLVVVLLGIGAVMLLEPRAEVWSIGSNHLVQVPVSNGLGGLFQSLPSPDYSKMLSTAVLLGAVTIAIVATLETLLNLEAVDKLDHQQRVSPPNRELVAQGTGNIVSGFLGGLPITSVIVRSSVNIASGGQTRLSCFIHGVFLLTTVAFFPYLLNRIPLSCLAAILMYTGFKLAGPATFKKMWLAGRQQFFPFVLTVIAIIVTDLLIGILIGMVIAIGFILYGNMRRPLRQVTERHVGGELTRIKLSNQVTFLNKASLMETLDQIPEQTHLVIDATETTHIDPDVVDLISDYQQDTAPVRNIQLSLVGFQSPILKNDLSHDLSVSTQDIQAKVTPSEVLQLMKEGNARFVRGEKVARNLIQQVDSTSQAQYPLATVLACMDSRVATEMIFDLGIGDIFSVRVAGNIAVDRTIGSCEYGCAVAGAKLLLVLGHTRCGAVMSSIDLAHQGKSALEATGCEHLDSVTSEITQVISADTTSEGERTSANTAFVDSITEANVRRNMHQLMEKSSRIRGLVEDGSLLLVGAVYNVKTGAVTFLED